MMHLGSSDVRFEYDSIEVRNVANCIIIMKFDQRN